MDFIDLQLLHGEKSGNFFTPVGAMRDRLPLDNPDLSLILKTFQDLFKLFVVLIRDVVRRPQVEQQQTSRFQRSQEPLGKINMLVKISNFDLSFKYILCTNFHIEVVFFFKALKIV